MLQILRLELIWGGCHSYIGNTLRLSGSYHWADTVIPHRLNGIIHHYTKPLNKLSVDKQSKCISKRPVTYI